MSLVSFGYEEQVTVGDETLTLCLNFRAITVAEGLLDLPFPVISAHARGQHRQLRVVGQLVWALLREHHSEVTLDQAAALFLSSGPKVAAQVGFALDSLLERAFPLVTEDRKRANPPKQHGRSKTSAAVG